MRLITTLTGNLAGYLQGERDRIAEAITRAVNDEGIRLRDELRAQVDAAGLGTGLSKAFRHEVYPKGRKSFSPAALVYSKAARLHAAFEDGPTIRANNAAWLVLPLPAAEALGFADRPQGRKNSARSRRARWSNVEAAIRRYGRLDFVPLDGGDRALLVARGLSRARQRGLKRSLTRRGAEAVASTVGESVPLFLLLRQVRIRKRLDIKAAGDRALDRLHSRVAGELLKLDR